MVKFVKLFIMKSDKVDMKKKIFALAAVVVSVIMCSVAANADEYRKALRLYEDGMTVRSRSVFDKLSKESAAADPKGWAVLCDVRMKTEGYEGMMEEFMEMNPHSVLIPQIRYAHAANLFDNQEYQAAAYEFSKIDMKSLHKDQVDEFMFWQAYCDLENRKMQSAAERFTTLASRPVTDYTAPAQYVLGYIKYEMKDFHSALGWFEQSVTDSRFAENSSWYIMECRFMMKDYAYVTRNAEKMYAEVPDERKPHLARIISESYLVMGDADKARKYYDLDTSDNAAKTRADWFYSGSLLYAVEDYKGAIDNYNMVTMRTDSIGQVANYNLGYCYIQTKNKVAAMQAFKDASMVYYDKKLTEDAYFNYAKLAFDLNDDPSVFRDYLAKYPEADKGDQINGYIAVAALYNHDYAGAVEAYDKIDDLDDDMRSNYMKANYLRARQLIANGSYRMAIPCLKVAAYYSDRGSRFNQLSRYWLAESHFRTEQYQEARKMYTELYNISALYGSPESHLIPYNIAYCFYQEEDYPSAIKWFDNYLSEKKTEFRKEALERKADCLFIAKDYDAAAAAYDLVLKDYFDVNDIYPYYQAAISYGLDRKNDRKIKLLSNVMEASPQAEFYPEALFELGRTYAVKEDDENAFKCFNKLAQEVKDSNYVAQAYIEMGSLARNQSQFNEALGYYKTVVEEMPHSGYAESALLAIESIYQTKDRPEEYIAYIENIGKGASKTADEKEMLYFNSAEQLFLSSNYQKALVSLQKYIDLYPSGKNVYKADFYMAESYRNLRQFEKACDSYRKVISDGEGSFVELSMLQFAKIAYDLERWDDSFGAYASLYEAAVLENNKHVALVGMMRSAYKGHEWQEVIKNADKVLFDSKTDAHLKQEAEYLKAKSYLASSRREEAFAILERLSADMSGAYGAEAAYLIILDCYDRGEFEEVEKKVYAFSDAGSGQTYWLAKSFIILGDTFVESGELKQAKATFESVRDGYEPQGEGDDVQDNVIMRLKKLDELIAEQN